MSAGDTYLLLNESSTAPLAPAVTQGWLQAVADAITLQLARDVTPAWGSGTLKRVAVAADPAVLPAGAFLFVIKDDLPEAPNAVAYHAVDGSGVAVAYLALNTCQTLDDVSVAISHEVIETFGDPGANRWADGGDGYEYALECCDAVEGNTYGITLGGLVVEVVVSDFVFPEFFNPGSPGPWDFAGAAPGPLRTAPGGYQIRRNTGSGETSIFGKLPPRARLHFFAGVGRPARRTRTP